MIGNIFVKECISVFWRGLVLFCLVIVTAGCSGSPRITFYTLQPAAQANAGELGNSPSVMIGPITLPELIDRPQIVVRVAANRVEILETHRWAEPLKEEIPRLIAENLSHLLKSNRVTTSSQHTTADADYRVLVDIQHFDSTPGESVTVDVVWSIRSISGKVPKIGRTKVQEPVGAEGYDQLAASYGRALLAVSSDLARNILAEAAAGH